MTPRTITLTALVCLGVGAPLAMAVEPAADPAASATPTASRPAFTVESVTPLDLGSMLASTPQWSPDGKWIAFSLPKGEGIGLVRPDGAGLRTLTREPGSGYRFAWSPDSTRIVMRAARKDKGPRQYVIRVLDVANGEVETSTEVLPEVQPPTWQRGPRGVRWVSHSPRGVVDGGWRDAPAFRKATEVPKLIIARDRSLVLDAPDPGARRKLSAAVGLNPVWNHDFSRIVFDAQDQIALSDVENAEGTSRVLCVGQHPAWSPDGEWIVYQITRDHSHAPEDGRQHTADTLPHLHDDKTNHRIVDSDLWVIRPEGTGRHQLTFTTDVIEVDPHWSPDAERIVCGTEDWGKLLVLKIRRQ